MTYLKEKTVNILKIWQEAHNINEIADITNETYSIIRNNYFKQFWKNDYLTRISRGRYIINQKGKNKIEEDEKIKNIEKMTVLLSKERKSNKIIKRELERILDITLTDTSLFSKISRLRKKYKIPKRNIKELGNIKIDGEFYELLGLILSDGYIGRYYIDFYNKDSSLLNYYKKIIENKGLHLKERSKESGAIAQTIHSIKLVTLINNFLTNKTRISDKIIKGKIINQRYFLRGIYSGDGCACISMSYRKSKKRWRIEPFISLAVFNENIIDKLIEILKNNGYNPYKNRDIIVLNKDKDIKRFYNNIRFIDGCKVRKSKYWNGIEKNKILKYISYYIKKDSKLKDLKTQEDKEKIVKYIKERLMQM